MAAVQHTLRWNKDLQEWFCATCGRTSDHTVEVDARAELDHFDCKIIGVPKRELTAEEREKWEQTERMREKF